jgi:hypothetical protein
MSDTHDKYWQECISEAADSCGATLTAEQIASIASDVRVSHENYCMAFYSPPASDWLSSMEREYKAKLDALQKELDQYKTTVERVVGRALHQWPDAKLSIDKDGKVWRYGGRIEQIA